MPIEAKLHMEPPCDVWNDIVLQMFQYMIKHFKNLLLRNQQADDLESWNYNTAPGTQVLPNLSDDGPVLTLTIVVTGSNLFPNASA